MSHQDTALRVRSNASEKTQQLATPNLCFGLQQVPSGTQDTHIRCHRMPYRLRGILMMMTRALDGSRDGQGWCDGATAPLVKTSFTCIRELKRETGIVLFFHPRCGSSLRDAGKKIETTKCDSIIPHDWNKSDVFRGIDLWKPTASLPCVLTSPVEGQLLLVERNTFHLCFPRFLVLRFA